VKGPAKAIFDGRGSYGNGGAMKIAPVSLYSYNNYDNLLHYVKEVTQITHAHELGINGAILQVITDSFVLIRKKMHTFNISMLTNYMLHKSLLLSQAIAIQQSLCLHPSEELNVSNFIDDLINKMDKIEVERYLKEKLYIIIYIDIIYI